MDTLLIVLALMLVAVAGIELFFPSTAARAALRLERARSRLRQAEAATAEFEFSYLEGGSGETLLLVHGFGADKDNFTRIARYLVGRFRVIAVDLPGFGASTRLPEAGYSIPDQAMRLHAVVEHLRLDSFHLGGSSMGGAIAIDYAARHPARVKSLWLLAPGGVMSASESEMIAEYRRHGRSLLVANVPQEFRRILDLTMHRRPFFPPSLKRVLASRAARDASLHTRIFEEMVNSPPSEERGREVTAPALIVWGREDRVLDMSGAAILAAAMPSATARVMDDVGHLPMIEAPRATAEDYIRFVEGLARP